MCLVAPIFFGRNSVCVVIIGTLLPEMLEGNESTARELDFPTVCDGARGVKFIEKIVESSKSDQKRLKSD